MRIPWRLVCLMSLLFISFAPVFLVSAGQLPKGFVYVEEIVPDIAIELQYYTEDNSVGERIVGYVVPRCIITREAAEALKMVPEDFRQKYPGIEWRAMAGMRDKLIHDYFGVDYDIMWDVLRNKIQSCIKKSSKS